MEKVTCVMMDFGSNENGRKYSKEAMENAVEEFMSRPEHQRLGEISRESDEPFTSLANVSHKVENMGFEGDKLLCKIELLDTPNGKIAQEIIKNGQSLKLGPKMIVEPIYELDEEGNPTDKIIGYKNLDIISIDII